MNKKIDFTLLPPEFLDVVLVLQDSAETGKYEKNGWLEGKGFTKEGNVASLIRHIKALMEGQEVDPESGLSHYLHIMCRSGMAYTLKKRGKLE
jgi:hypothetical protein